jgi:hypothetical protein
MGARGARAGGGGRARGGCSRPIDRREEMPTRKVASDPEAPSRREPPPEGSP